MSPHNMNILENEFQAREQQRRKKIVVVHSYQHAPVSNCKFDFFKESIGDVWSLYLRTRNTQIT